MRLEELQVDLRPRPARLAVDLGSWILHRHAGPVWAAWAAVWAPISALACLVSLLPYGALWGPLFLWWIRPWPERIVVTVLSRATFGQTPTVRQSLAMWWTEGRRGLAGFLLWGRPLGIARSLRQPVWMLEGADPSDARRRARELSASGAGRAAVGWGLACAHFEAIAALGILGFAGLFASSPGIANPFALADRIFPDGGSDGSSTWLGPATSLCCALAAGVVAPFHSAGGFSLYLSRRGELEAWDLEIGLRRLAGRIRRIPSTVSIFLAALLLAAPPPARAATCADSVASAARFAADRPPARDAEQASTRAEIDRILSAPDLAPWRCERAWVPRHPEPEERARPSEPGFLARAIAAAMSIVSACAPLFKWGSIAAVAGFLVWILVRHRDPPQVEFDRPALPDGGVGRPIPLPPGATADAATAAQAADLAGAAWEAGRRREALGLLLRATLGLLERLHGLRMAAGETEGALRRLLPRLPPDRAASTAKLLSAWTRTAWAGVPPAEAEFRELLASWRAAWGAA